MSLSKLKQVDNRSRMVIFGYIRRFETKHQHVTIPMMIQYLFLIYYWINEKFTVHGDDIKLEQDGKVATRLKKIIAPYHTAYGNHTIDLADTSIIAYQWTFQIRDIPFKNLSPICIGIDASSDKYISHDFTAAYYNHCEFYSIGSNNNVYNRRWSEWSDNNLKLLRKWRKDDILVLLLNVQSKNFKIKMDGQEGLIANNIWFQNTKYNLGVALPHENARVELIDFQTFHRNA